MAKIIRVTQCGHKDCGKSFQYSYDLARIPADTTDFPLSCPFCQTKQRVPLHSTHKVEVLRDGKQQETVVLEVPEHPVGIVEETPSQSSSS